MSKKKPSSDRKKPSPEFTPEFNAAVLAVAWAETVDILKAHGVTPPASPEAAMQELMAMKPGELAKALKL